MRNLRRDRIVVCVELLEAIQKHPNTSVTRILSIVGINAIEKKSGTAEIMLKQGLLRLEKKSKGKGDCYMVTPKGREWLSKTQEVLQAIN